MFGRSVGVLLAVLAIAAFAVGCGSSGDDTTGGGGGDNTSASSGAETDGETTAASGEEEGGEEEGDGAEEASDGGEEGEGGGSGATASSTSIPKKKYVEEGDKLCEVVPNEYQELLGKLPKKQQENKQISVPKAAIPPLRKASEEFAKLGSPNGNQAEAQAVIDALEAAADGLEEEPKGELSGPKSSFVEFNKLTQKMGMESCGQL